jgi:hypothetical protein
VAVLAGIAGTLSLTSAKSGLLVGVAISVTTVPAAANAAVALSYGDTTQTIGSTNQLLLNLLGIVLAGTLTLLAQKWLWSRQRRNRAASRGAFQGARGTAQSLRGAGNCATSSHNQPAPRNERLPPPPTRPKNHPSADFTASANRPATDRA